MIIEIKSWITGGVLFSIETETMRMAVVAAVESRANLSGADLSRANLSRADLSRANLYGANLYGADLSRANLSRANLSRANLYGANLYGANLYGADLSGANLYGANLSGANLYGADLSRANLSGADLSRADLSGANLYGADLYGADLSGANNIPLVVIIGSRHSLLLQRDGQLIIGCHCKPLTWWVEHYKGIGEKEGYTANQIAEYGGYIEKLAAFMPVATAAQDASCKP